jgi:hypothetical protein
MEKVLSTWMLITNIIDKEKVDAKTIAKWYY